MTAARSSGKARNTNLGRVTIKSIARDLGISHMTVSRALSNHPNVLETTRKRVLERAEELGYVRNAAAMAMRGGGTEIVGLILPNIVNEFYARFANTMAQACEEQSYHLIIHLTDDRFEVEQQSIRRLREVQATAVVLVPAPGRHGKEPVRLGSMRVIQLIRQRPMDGQAAAILVDDHDALRDAVVHLAAHGHSRIAYIGADPTLSSGRNRRRAFADGIAAAGLAEVPDLQFLDMPSFSMGRACARRILQEGRATAIICSGFEISNGALSAFMEAGTEATHGVAFIGYGDPSFHAWINGGISTIRVPVDDLAYQAVGMLEDASEARGTEKTFKAELVVRQLCPGSSGGRVS